MKNNVKRAGSRKKQRNKVWAFKNSYTHEDLSVYSIADVVNAAAEKAGLKPGSKIETRDAEKRKSAVLGICPVCKQQLVYIGGNVAACKNESCKGIAYKATKDEQEITLYRPVYKTLHVGSQVFIENVLS